MMEQEAWPSPQEPSREPLPRLEDLPVAEQGYEQESVKAAFDSFYRHAAQIDAALRTLEAVDSFHRQAAALRSDLRALRSAGWTQQTWTAPPSYSYGARGAREGIPPAVWRIAGEVFFLIAVAVALGVAKLSWWAILLAMAGAFAIVCLIEWLAGREQYTFARPAPASSPHPVVEAERVDDTEESLGWTAFEEAQEPSDAMTIIGAPPRETDEVVEEPEPEAEPEPEPEPAAELQQQEEDEDDAEPEEPELPPAAEVEATEAAAEKRRWWRRGGESEAAEPSDEVALPSHVRVLPPSDPWDEGFDEPVAAEADELAGEPDEETEEPLLVDEPDRRRFRRR
jgi:hypothetical protein